jgi:peptidoglycan/LPS O-acetylase OafA/YrhL
VIQHYSIHPKYRPDIDGLRAIAILAVVGFHAFPEWVKGGFVGVDIFFVISGFLISSIIFGNLEKNTFSYRDFYVRRIKRIFPALIVVLATSYAAGWYLLLPDEFKQLGKHIAAGAGFVSNLVLWNEAGYFDNASYTKPLLHLWSLGIEEQFYIFWPLLLGLVWKRRLNFLAITILIAVASFAVNVFTVASNQVADFYSPLSRFWELMAGGVLAYLALHKPHHLPRNTNLQSIIGLLLIVVAAARIDQASAFPGWWALLPTAGAFLLISAQPTAWVNRHVLGNRVLVWIGLVSYPLYLWHWTILSFLRITESGIPSVKVRIAAVLASLLLAWLTYWAIEKPIRFRANGNWIIAVLCVLLALIALAGFNTYQRDGLGFRMMKISPELMGYKPDLARDWRQGLCFLEDSDRFSAACLGHKKPLIFLWGDSHAAALYSGLQRLQNDFQFGIAQYTAAGCEPLIGRYFAGDRFCKGINDADLAMIAKIKPEFVLLHANWQEINVHRSHSNDLADLELTISSLKKIGIAHIVLLGPVPAWQEDLPRIIFSYYRKEHRKPPLRLPIQDADAARRLDTAMRKLATAQGIRYISSLDILCNPDGCLTRTAPDSVDIMTMDTGHLTPAGASYLARFILMDILKPAAAPEGSSDRAQ